MKASSMQNHFDVTRSKCRQTKPIVWATLLILMSRHADRSSSSLYLADLRSMQYGCKFATVCVRKGYGIIASTLGLVGVVRKWAWHTKFFTHAYARITYLAPPLAKFWDRPCGPCSQHFCYCRFP